MRVTILGSGQDAGTPQLFCRCSNCRAAAKTSSLRRSASSVLVSVGGRSWLLDASSDLREQLLRHAPNTTIDAIAITHAHAGHISGLLSFGKEGPYSEAQVWGTETLISMLQHNEPWAHLFPQMTPRVVRKDIEVPGSGLRFRFHPIDHRREVTDTVAIEVRHGKRGVLYMPDTDRIDDKVWEATKSLGRGDVLLFDGCFWGDPKELPGRDLSSIPHPMLRNSIAALAPLRERGVRVVFTHINHSNPINRPNGPERRKVKAAGFEVASDGMRVL